VKASIEGAEQQSRIWHNSIKIRHLRYLLDQRSIAASRSSIWAAYNRAVDSQSGWSNRSPVTLTGRVLGLDVGTRRIGMAVSDALGITAQGIKTLERTNKRRDFEHLERVIREYEVKEIVVGLPLRMSGAEGTQSEKMRAFAEELGKKFGLPVHLWDERLTSAEANRFLRETELSIEKRGKAVDRMAAVLILQGWMESQRTGTRDQLPDFDASK
jgi:putative holliday junction resolvase